jgi:signal transduction histidine kinase
VNCCISVADPATEPAAQAPEIRRPAGRSRDRRGRLLRGYLHKSSNSLCGIKGYASLIAGGPGSGGRSTAWARKIIAEVERLEDIYQSVREMAFPVPAPAPAPDADPALVLADACDTAAARHANLRLAPLPPLAGRLLLPAGDLLQVLGAVLDNCAESRSEPVAVTMVPTVTDDGRQLLTVADDGPGMPRDLLLQAVDPFVTTREGHLGIGLSRVDTIMDMHGLGWGLRSVPDGGTTVTLEIAAAGAAGARG